MRAFSFILVALAAVAAAKPIAEPVADTSSSCQDIERDAFVDGLKQAGVDVSNGFWVDQDGLNKRACTRSGATYTRSGGIYCLAYVIIIACDVPKDKFE